MAGALLHSRGHSSFLAFIGGGVASRCLPSVCVYLQGSRRLQVKQSSSVADVRRCVQACLAYLAQVAFHSSSWHHGLTGICALKMLMLTPVEER